MTEPEDRSPDPDRGFIEALAEFDDRAAGRLRPDSAGGHGAPTDPDQEWGRLTALLALVERAWPRDLPAQMSDVATIPMDPSGMADTAPLEKCPTGVSDPQDFGRSDTPVGHQDLGTDTSVGRPQGTSFGRFQILGPLGQGGYGIVFLAWDPEARRKVALKVPQPEALITPASRKRFQREAHAASALDHPNIIPIYETGSVGTILYIASAYCPGPSLAAWIASRAGPVPIRDAAGLVVALARAVEHAHDRAVLHRDLKPGNVLLQPIAPAVGIEANGGGDRDGSTGNHFDELADYQPRLTDFSLARIADAEGPHTRSGLPFGSPPYMSPEQAEGRVGDMGPATDVYALGVILYELLVGSPPFRGDSSVQLLRSVCADEPPPPRRLRRDVPAPLEAIALMCLRKDPAKRYPSACSLADDLDRFLAGEPTRARPPSAAGRIGRCVRRHRLSAAVLGLIAAFLATGLAASRWYKSRVAEMTSLADRKDAEVRLRAEEARREAEAKRRLEYDVDVRQAADFVRSLQTDLALQRLERHLPRPGETDLREFTWRHLMRRCHDEQQTLEGHQGDVYHAEFSPDGKVVATSGQDGTVRFWDARTGGMIGSPLQAHASEINWISFSPDGATLATASDDGTVRLRDVESRALLKTLKGHRENAVVARFTADGNRVVSCGRDDGLVIVWDRTTGGVVRTFKAAGTETAKEEIENMAISPEGKLIVVTGRPQNATVWDLHAGMKRADLDGHRGMVEAVAFSHDGSKLATGSADDSIRIWGAKDFRLLREVRDHANVRSVVFSSDDAWLISGGDDGCVGVWDVATGILIKRLRGHRSRIWGVSISPDGRTIASASRDQSIKLWDFEAPGAQVRGTTENLPRLQDAVFSPDGASFLTAHAGGTVAFWDARTGRLLERRDLGPPSETPLGFRLPCAFDASGNRMAFVEPNQSVALHDLARRKRLIDTGPIAGGVATLEMNAQGTWFFFGDLRGGGSAWNIAENRRVPFPVTHDGWRRVPWSNQVIIRERDGSGSTLWDYQRNTTEHDRFRDYILCVSGRIPLWVNDSDGIHLRTFQGTKPVDVGDFQGPQGAVLAASFSRDDKTLAVAYKSGVVALWDVASQRELARLEQQTDHRPYLVRFSEDGKTLATCAELPNNQSEVFLWQGTSP